MSKIEEKIEREAKIAAANYDNPFDEPCYDEHFYDGFKAGAEWALQHQWVSVDDALPKNGENCVIMDKYGLTRVAAYNAENKYWEMDFIGDVYRYEIRTVRHWTPIPPLTEARKEGEL